MLATYSHRTRILMFTMLLSIASGVQAVPTGVEQIGRKLEVGDLVFIRIPHQPFIEVADTTMSWTNHVGIVVDTSGDEPIIAESRVPVSGATSWPHFVARSERGRVAVLRPGVVLNGRQRRELRRAAVARYGIHYDTGFDLYSRGEFCSRYVREVLQQATGIKFGRVENFSHLLKKNPHANLLFWRAWYFGYIPWQRETVTPASLLDDKKLHRVFDGRVRRINLTKGGRS